MNSSFCPVILNQGLAIFGPIGLVACALSSRATPIATRNSGSSIAALLRPRVGRQNKIHSVKVSRSPSSINVPERRAK